MPNVQLFDLGELCHRRDVLGGQPVAGIDLEASLRPQRGGGPDLGKLGFAPGRLGAGVASVLIS